MYGDKAVVLIRNPYKVIVSYWRHMTYGIHSDTNGATAPKYWPMPLDNTKMFKPEDLQSEQFHQFVLATIDDWARSILDWIILKKAVVVHFEDFVKDREREMMRILSHLDIEVNETRKSCALNLSFEKYKRKTVETEYSFSEEVIKVVRDKMEIVNKILKQMGHKEIQN